MPDRDTLGGDVIRAMQVEYEQAAVAPRVPRQRQVPPALFISDEEEMSMIDEDRIADAIRDGAATPAELAERLGVPVDDRLTWRLAELVHAGRLTMTRTGDGHHLTVVR